jgi:hypothetical protein
MFAAAYMGRKSRAKPVQSVYDMDEQMWVG